MAYVSKHIIKDIRAYCVDVDPVKMQVALAQERAEEDIEQMKLAKRKQWEESEYRRLYIEMFGNDRDHSADTGKMLEEKPGGKPEDDSEDIEIEIIKGQRRVCRGCGKEKPSNCYRMTRLFNIPPYCTVCQNKSVRELKCHSKTAFAHGVLVYKRCESCGLTKLVRDFAKSVKSPDGYRRFCKTCIRERRKK